MQIISESVQMLFT